MRHLRLSVLLVLATPVAVPLAAQVGAPGGPIPVELLRQRRAAFLASSPAGVVVIEASRTKNIDRGDYPQDSDYREANNFLYFTGVESPGSRLVFVQPDSGSSKGTVRLYLPARPATPDRWSAARIYADSIAAAATGLELGTEILPMPVPARPAAGTPRTASGPIVNAPVDPFATVADSILAATGLERLDPRRTMGGLRSVKDADELRRLRRASEISAEAHRMAMLHARPGMWEYEIEAIVEYTFRRMGAERVGYPSIVGAGFNGTILHYDVSRAQAKDGDLVLIDAAAEFGYYTADLTRTFPVNGKFTPRQKELYELVLRAQQAAIDSIRPGITLARIQQIPREYLKANSGTICGEQACDRYLIHGTSHMVGMDVHDINNPFFREIGPGWTFVVEPGIYIPEEKIGIRIEDVILVTPTGSEILTRNAPRTVADIEQLMAEGRRMASALPQASR